MYQYIYLSGTHTLTASWSEKCIGSINVLYISKLSLSTYTWSKVLPNKWVGSLTICARFSLANDLVKMLSCVALTLKSPRIMLFFPCQTYRQDMSWQV